MSAGPPEYAVRPATAADSDALFALHRASLGPYVEAIYGPWDDEVQKGFHDAWFDPARLLVITADSHVVGVLDCTVDQEAVSLNRIALDPTCQGQGIGTALITEVLAQADEHRLPVTLEVFDLNPARRLYERLGFVETRRVDRKIHMTRPAAPEQATLSPASGQPTD